MVLTGNQRREVKMPFGKILGALATSIGPKIVEGLGGKMGMSNEYAQAAGSAVPAMTKIAGIPLPGQGASLGQDMKAYMDKAFPGTNPWERLGSQYAGAGVESAKVSTKSQEKMQVKELASRERIAKIQAGATTEAAAIAHGPDAVTSISGRKVDPYDTTTQQARERLPHEIAKLVEEGKLTGSQATIEKAKAQIADALAAAGLTKEQFPNLYASLANIGKGVAKSSAGGTKRKVTTQNRNKAWNTFVKELQRLLSGNAKSFNERRAPVITSVPGSTHYKNSIKQ